MDKLCKVISVSEYHGLSRGGKDYKLRTLEVDYKGEKVRIKTFDETANLGDYVEIGIGIKRSVYGAEFVADIKRIVSADQVKIEQ